MSDLGSIVSNGITNGSIYALVALGFVLIYRNSGVFNFAHPQIGMMGGFVFFVLWVEQSLPYPLAALGGVAVSALIALSVRQLLAPQEHNPLNMLIGTLGVSGILAWVAFDVWGSTPAFVPPIGGGVRIEFWGMTFRGPALIVIGVLIVVSAGLALFTRYSSSGLAMRAVSSDPGASTLMGINVGLVSTLTWVAAGALSGAAAVLVAPFVNMEPLFMSLLFIRALSAALLGGMNSLTGTVVAGISIGLFEAAVIRNTTTVGLPELLLVLMIVMTLLIRPGSLGRTTA